MNYLWCRSSFERHLKVNCCEVNICEIRPRIIKSADDKATKDSKTSVFKLMSTTQSFFLNVFLSEICYWIHVRLIEYKKVLCYGVHQSHFSVRTNKSHITIPYMGFFTNFTAFTIQTAFYYSKGTKSSQTLFLTWCLHALSTYGVSSTI